MREQRLNCTSCRRHPPRSASLPSPSPLKMSLYKVWENACEPRFRSVFGGNAFRFRLDLLHFRGPVTWAGSRSARQPNLPMAREFGALRWHTCAAGAFLVLFLGMCAGRLEGCPTRAGTEMSTRFAKERAGEVLALWEVGASAVLTREHPSACSLPNTAWILRGNTHPATPPRPLSRYGKPR